MSQKEFKTMLEELIAAEEERLQVGSEDFLRRHQEIMTLIGEAEQYQKERKEKMKRREQVQIILEELNKEYSVPGYMEEDVIKGIIAGLRRIEKEGGEDWKSNS